MGSDLARFTASGARLAALCATVVSAAGCIRPTSLAAPEDNQVILATNGGAPFVTFASPETLAFDGDLLALLVLERPLVELAPEAQDPARRRVGLVTPMPGRDRRLPWVMALSLEGTPLDQLPEAARDLQLRPFDDDACAGLGGCLDLAEGGVAPGHEWCHVPCPLTAPTAPAPPAAPAAPDRPTTASACGVRSASIDGSGTSAATTRCVVPEPAVEACRDTERPSARGCVPLSPCVGEDFPTDVDDRRAWFVDGGATIDGDGRRGSPRRALDLGSLPPAVDVVLARGTVVLSDAPSRRTAVTIRGLCASGLTIIGTATIAADLTIEDATIEAFVTTRGATFAARRVAVAGGQLRVDTSAGGALRLAEARLHHRGRRPLVDVHSGRATLDDLAIVGSATTSAIAARTAEVSARGLEVDGPMLLSSGAGAKVELTRVRWRGAAGRRLASARSSTLALSDVAITASHLAALDLEDATLEAHDVALRADGPLGTARGLITGRASGVTLDRVDVSTRSGGALTLDGGALRARDLFVRVEDRADDGALALTDVVTELERLEAAIGAGRVVAASRGVFSASHVFARRPLGPPTASCATPAIDLEAMRAVQVRSASVSGFDRALAIGGPEAARVQEALVVDLSVSGRGASTIGDGCVAVDISAHRAAVARLSARDVERALLLAAAPLEGRALVSDLRVRDARRVGGSGEGCALGSEIPGGVQAEPAVRIELPTPGTASIARVRLDMLERRGLTIGGPRGAAVRFDEFRAVEVPCRVVGATDHVRIVGARHAVQRTLASPRALALDDVYDVDDDAALHLSDVNVDALSARSVVNASPRASFTMSRWRVKFAELLLSVEKDEIDPGKVRLFQDGAAERLGRMTRHEEGSCAPLLEQPLFVRVRVPRGTSFWSTCR